MIIEERMLGVKVKSQEEKEVSIFGEMSQFHVIASNGNS